jgi:rubrerythrin
MSQEKQETEFELSWWYVCPSCTVVRVMRNDDECPACGFEGDPDRFRQRMEER